MTSIEFVKMHGAGNDFVVFDDRSNSLEISADAVVSICDRRFGIGADGVIRIGKSYKGDAFMDYRNADGSVAEMCGNGVRVVGKFMGDRRLVGDEMILETRGGNKPIRLHREGDVVVRSTVNMGIVEQEGDVVLSDVADGLGLALANTGNPHAMLVVDDLDAFPLAEIGPLVEHHSTFPSGRNLAVVELVAGGFRQRTWERGCDETHACGTAASAAFAMLNRKGFVGEAAHIELKGGTLEMAFAPNGSVLMTGPAEETFTGTLAAGSYGINS